MVVLCRKWEEVHAPDIGEFEYVTANSYSKQEVCLVSRSSTVCRVPTPPGKSWIFFKNSRTGKVLENHFGPGKSWKNILENYALRHFCSEF